MLERTYWTMSPLPFPEGLPEVLATWRQHGLAAGHSLRTIDARASTIARLAVMGVDPMTATPAQLTGWLGGQDLRASSLATYRAQLRAFYAFLEATGRRADDPTARLPRPRVRPGVPRPWTPEQVQAVLAACADPRAHQTRAYVTLAAFAGLRVHEIAKVAGQDIQDGQLHVLGKGGREAWLPMHPLVVELATRMPVAGYWFPSETARGHVHRVSVSQAIKRAMVRAGVSGTPHAARHFYGTQVLRSSGGDLRLTQRAMRHASPATTAIYTQVDGDALTRAIAGIPA